MSFGKPGRPPEDELARQREIYEAVAPLILEVGPRRLSMRDAACAAPMSVRGFYHYFPTKRDLVLHGLRWDARNRLCREYCERMTDLSGWSSEGYIEAYLDLSTRMFAFIRPSVQAALGLDAEELQEGLDSGLRGNVGELVESLRLVVTGIPEPDLEPLARALRRVVLGTLVD
jgi:AcrR family transcriptional regulator